MKTRSGIIIRRCFLFWIYQPGTLQVQYLLNLTLDHHQLRSPKWTYRDCANFILPKDCRLNATLRRIPRWECINRPFRQVQNLVALNPSSSCQSFGVPDSSAPISPARNLRSVPGLGWLSPSQPTPIKPGHAAGEHPERRPN